MTRESIEDLIDKGLAAQDAYFNSGAFRHTAEGGMLAVLNAVLPKEAEMVSKAPMEQSERTGLVERLRKGSRAIYAALGAAEGADDISAMLREASFMLEADDVLLSPDARPAPMTEEVKDALYGTARVYREILSAHSDDLTRKVAEAEGRAFAAEHALGHEIEIKGAIVTKLREAETILRMWKTGAADRHAHRDAFLAGQPLSRPQETDAVLAERDALLLRVMAQAESDLAAAHAEICKLQGLDPATATWPTWSAPANTIRWFATIRAALSAGSRPSPGPATETDVTPAMVHAALAAFNGNWQLPYGAMRDALKAALLASVRPKQEGV